MSTEPARAPLATRLTAWLNDPLDPLWERPAPTARQQRDDVIAAVGLVAVAIVSVVLTKSMGARIEGEEAWRAYVAVALMVAPLALRRRRPVLVLVVSSGLFLGLSYVSPEASTSLMFQAAYFAALYAAVAWARDRRLLWIAIGVVLLTMALWLVVMYTISSGADQFMNADPAGPVPQFAAAVLFTALINLAYFGGAILIGRSSWRGALQRVRLAEQAEQISDQADELARRAVVDERLRIARELHDVVAHHVSVIGVQAGAARKVLPRKPEAAEGALRTIESASREAVGEMRSLLGVLRSETSLGRTGGEDRAPEPGLADLADLARHHRERGLDVHLTLHEEHPDDLERVTEPLALSIYRCVQESLTNVVRHSTATSASVTVRTGTTASTADAGSPQPSRWVEVEVVDDGRPRPGTAGTGFGLRGVSERVALHGGEAEIGPRRTGTGWRVRARFTVRALERETA
ncbi:sensor histidine kinase [Georgenia subflava]|uniref:histidine kinase n=1 Tax=Georgenia subflava TaxID=1622177 RepID=A0A6N7ELI7_9MICO|nr:histidine kinase [Georgenia subflava]MPV36114.1 sensor histidine kinase [Georgenia subflava]